MSIKFNTALLLLCLILCSCGLVQQIKLSKAKEQQYLLATDYNYTIPFELINGYILVKVNIEGESFDFLFDTGAPLCIDSSLAVQLKKVPITKKSLADAYGNKKQLEIHGLSSISLSEVKWYNAPFYTFNFSHANENSGLKVVGVFGASLMKDAIWQIDYRKQVITITDQLESLSIGTKVIILDFERNTTESPVLNLRVDNESLSILLDTGSPYAISLKAEDFPALKKEGSPMPLNKRSLFAPKADSSFHIQNKRIVFNEDLSLKQVSVRLSNGLKDNLLGNDFLKDYKLTIDWIYDTIYLETYE